MNNYQVPEVLPGIRNVYAATKLRLVGNIDVLIRRNVGIVDAGVVDGQGRRYPFSAEEEHILESVEADMAQEGFTLRDYRYYPMDPITREEIHDLAGYNQAGQEEVRRIRYYQSDDTPQETQGVSL